MKILQVFDFFSPQLGGGTVGLIRKLSQTLVNMGNEVTICTSNFKTDQNYIDSLPEVKFLLYHNWFNLINFYFTPSLVTLDITNYDIIHFHCYRSFQNVLVSKLAIRSSIPYIINAHGSAAKTSSSTRLLKILYDRIFSKSIISNASKFVATNLVSQQEYLDLGIPLEKITIIHPFIDLAEFTCLPRKGLFKSSHRINTKYMILFMGRINKIKGLEFLIESFYQLCKTIDEITLVIAGTDDGYWGYVRKLIIRLGLDDKVLYVGYISGIEKKAALVDANMLVQVSSHEQGAGSPFEAIICDTPVIVTKGTGAGEDIINSQGGYLVDYNKTQELASTINFILNNPDIASQKAKIGKEWIKANLSLDSRVAKYEQLYREVISAKINK